MDSSENLKRGLPDVLLTLMLTACFLVKNGRLRYKPDG
jgi:hypothetical protein